MSATEIVEVLPLVWFCRVDSRTVLVSRLARTSFITMRQKMAVSRTRMALIGMRSRCCLDLVSQQASVPMFGWKTDWAGRVSWARRRARVRVRGPPQPTTE